MSNQMGTPANKLYSNALSEEVDERLPPPKGSTAEFKEIWNRITADKKPNFFMDSDLDILKEYVNITLQIKEVFQDLEAEGYVQADRFGGVRQHALVPVMSALRRQHIAYAHILGIGPEGRTAESSSAIRRTKAASVKTTGKGVLIPLAGGRKG